MTSTASHDPIDPTAGQQARRPDELEDWLTDLRVNLGDDPPDWLTPVDDIADLAREPSPVSLPTEDPSEQEGGTAANSTGPSRGLTGDPTGPAAGRHRAAD